MEAVRKEAQKELNKKSRLRYKHTASVLRKAHIKLKNDEKERLFQILTTNKKLESAYWLKEDFRKIFACHNREYARETLKEWIKYATDSGIKRFADCARTMSEWSRSILNSTECCYTNGRIEGMNNKIKVLKRVSFGVRNFERFRNRILHTV